MRLAKVKRIVNRSIVGAIISVVIHGTSFANLPIVAEDLDVEVITSIDFNPASISADANGNLYFGNYDATPNGKIKKLVISTGVVTDFGGTIDDPDAVIVDKNGDVGVVGSILVGGVIGSCGGGCRIGRLSEISANGATTQTLHEGSCIGNPSAMAFDSLGRLLIVSVTDSAI